jgi:hypothetical protein
MVFDNNDNLYVLDTTYKNILKIDKSGSISLLSSFDSGSINCVVYYNNHLYVSVHDYLSYGSN